MIANFATRAMVCFVAGLSLLALSFTVRAQVDFPARTVTLVNPYPPGGLADSTARQLANRLSTVWKQPVIVDTKPGANGNGAGVSVVRGGRMVRRWTGGDAQSDRGVPRWSEKIFGAPRGWA